MIFKGFLFYYLKTCIHFKNKKKRLLKVKCLLEFRNNKKIIYFFILNVYLPEKVEIFPLE